MNSDLFTYTTITEPFSEEFILQICKLHSKKPKLLLKYFAMLVNIEKNTEVPLLSIVCCYSGKDELVGTVFVYFPDPMLPFDKKFGFFSNVFVKLEFRKRGIASKLFDVALSLFNESHCLGVFLATNSAKLRNKYYSRFGFERFHNDPYLMVKYFNSMLCISSYNPCVYLKEISLFDLASLQSICSQRHYLLHTKRNNEALEIVSTEIEEKFIINICEEKKQFLCVVNRKGNPICIWFCIEEDLSLEIVLLIHE